ESPPRRRLLSGADLSFSGLPRPKSSRREGGRAWAGGVLLEYRVGGIDLPKHDIIAPEVGEMLEHTPGIHLVEQASIQDGMAQQETPVAGKIDIDHLDVRI